MAGLSDLLRERVDIKPARHHTRPVAVGTVVIVTMVIALVSAVTHHVPLLPASGQVVQAAFRSADQVSGRSVVRVNGVDVGQVVGVGPGADPLRSSLVTMRITGSGVHLHSDASAQIRWRTVFGGLVYVDLHPGSSSAPPLSGPIPVSHTSDQVELDQILDTYSGPTPQEQRNLIAGLRSALAAPAAIDRTIGTLAPTLSSASAGLQPLLGTDSGDLRGVVAATARTVSGLDDTAALQGLVTGAEQTLAATDAAQARLGRSLSLLPPSLSSTFTTMARLRTTLGHLDPLVAQLQPGATAVAPAVRVAIPALGRLDVVLHDARPLLRDAGPTFDALRSASDTGVPLMTALNPTLSRLLSQLLPFLESADSSTKLKIYESIGPFFSSIDSAASQLDSVGHRIRLSVPPSISGFLTSPPSAAMTSACASSALAGRQGVCAKLVAALTRGWFTARSARGGTR